MPNLEIKNLCVSVLEKEILKDFNLNIKSGEIHAIMGPNGTGKSTLSKVIMGCDTYNVNNGDILYNDVSIINLTTDKRAKMGIFLGMQSPREIEGLTNADMLRTAIHEKEGKDFKLISFIKELDKMTQKLNMNKDMVHRDVNVNFSGGEKKKNEILQMYMLKPSLIILDEIDSGLDIDSLKLISKMVMDYYKEYKPSILLITHYQRLLDYINPDYVHIMNDGKIIESGNKELINIIEEKGYDFFKKNDIFKTSIMKEN